MRISARRAAQDLSARRLKSVRFGRCDAVARCRCAPVLRIGNSIAIIGRLPRFGLRPEPKNHEQQRWPSIKNAVAYILYRTGTRLLHIADTAQGARLCHALQRQPSLSVFAEPNTVSLLARRWRACAPGALGPDPNTTEPTRWKPRNNISS